jgi:GntR family transcriptional regulator
MNRLQFLPHKFATRPLYLLVRDALVQRVVAGEWRPGMALPNEFELAKALGVSIGTVRKALAEMENERIILRKQGRGTFVADQSTGELAIRFSNLRDPQGNPIHGLNQNCDWTRGSANAEEIETLKLRGSAEVIRVLRNRTHHDRVFAWDQCVLPAALYSKLPDNVGDYRITALAQGNGLLLARGLETVTADLAGPEDAARLDVAQGSPLLVLNRIVACNDGKIAEWRVARCHLRDMKYAAETT